MIGRNGSYFDSDLALKGHYIITGNTNDNFCSDLLQITDVREELHQHLRDRGFEAVFFFDYTNMLYCYDYQSFRILTNAVEPVQQNEETQPAVTESDGVEEGPFGDELEAFLAAYMPQEEQAPPPQRQDAPMRLNLGTMGMQTAWQQVITMLRSGRHRCALVLSNINSMQTTFSVPALQALQELTAGSSNNSSVVIYLFRGKTMTEMLRSQGRYGTDEWNIFFQSVLLPLMETDDPEENRVISLRTPSDQEILNLLNNIRYDGNVSMSVEPRDLKTLASNLAYACAREDWNLKRLRSRILDYSRKNPNTVLTLENYCSITGLPRHTTALEDLERLIGLEDVKKELRKRSRNMQSMYGRKRPFEGSSRFLPLRQTNIVRGHLLNICFMGNSGTGKSELARLIGRMYYEANVLPQGHLVPASASTIVSQNVGGTAIRVRELVQEAMGGVLFIDEAYALMKNEHGREAIDQLVNDMTTFEGQFAVVIAGYPRQMKRLMQTNEGLASRFGTVFELPDYTPHEMRRIFELFLKNDPDPLELDPELAEKLSVFCENWATDHDRSWGNAREAERLVAKLKQNALDRIGREHRQPQQKRPVVITKEDIPPELRKHLKPMAQNLQEALLDIDNMIGLTGVKQFLRKLADGNLWEDHQPTPGRFIFHGPPGTGKTHVARLMGMLLFQLDVLQRAYVYEVAAQDLLRPDPQIDYGGDNNPSVQEILQAAVENAKGGIFFIDEAHQLADTDAGRAVLRALVPIVENPEYRNSTCFILAGYTTEMRQLLRQDAGLARRFPETNRIRFDSYTAHELTAILAGMAREQGQNPTKEYLDRTCVALNKYLENPDENYGNAGFIRDTYLPESLRARLTRLNREYAGSDTALVDRAVARNVDQAEKIRLTEYDLPRQFQAMAGPLGLPVPPEKDAWDRVRELVGKEDVKEYLLARRESGEQPMFYDNHHQTGLHFAVVGPTGSGRHTVIRTMAALWKHLGLLTRDNVRFASKGDLEAGYVGQTSLKAAAVVEEAQGGCLAVEYPSAMLPGDGSQNSFGPEALAVINGAMADPMSKVSVVLLDTEEGIEELFRKMPSMKSRISRVFRLEDLSPDEMYQLFRLKTDNAISFHEEIAELIPEFFLNWVSQRGGLNEASRSWGNGAEVDQLIDELISRWKSQGGVKDPDSTIPKRLITREHFPAELQRFLTRTRADKDTAMSELMKMTGLEGVKKVVRALEREGRMLKGKKLDPGFYAFVGYPGTGKTTVARLMGGVLRAAGALSQGHVIERTAQQLVQRPSEFAEALKLAKNGILFIDEAPQLAEWDSGRRVIQELLTALENTKITSCTCIILAGYPREMGRLISADPGLASRFGTEDARVVFENYKPAELLSILRTMAENADKISQIKAHQPLVLDASFQSVSLELFCRVARSGNHDFGNARYVRNHLRDCYKRLLERIDRLYPEGDYPPEELCTLTEEDIAPHLRTILEKEEIPALIHYEKLNTQEPGPITDDNRGEFLEEYYQRIVLLECEQDSDRKSTGTGTIISQDGCVLTCAHVVRGASRIRARIYCPGALGGDFRWLECQTLYPIDETHDMALLKMIGKNFLSMPIRPGHLPVLPTESTLMSGYPLGTMLNGDDADTLQPSYFEGQIASIQAKRRSNEEVLHYYLDGRGLHGNSGSPVISKTDGRVIGVFSGSIHPETEGNLDELNFFFPIPYFWSNFVVGEIPVAPPEEE